MKQAFGTAIHKYVVKGRAHWANVSNPSIPTALAPVIAGFDSLRDFRRKAQNMFVGTIPKKQTTDVARTEINVPQASLRREPFLRAGPYDFATIYDELPLWNATPAINGSGETIAIVGRTDINPNDATTFWSLFGLDGTHAPQPTLNIITNGPDPGFNPG